MSLSTEYPILWLDFSVLETFTETIIPYEKRDPGYQTDK